MVYKESCILILPIAVYEILIFIPESISSFFAVPCYVAVLCVSSFTVESFWQIVNEIYAEKSYSQSMIKKCRWCTKLAMILFAVCIALSIILGTVSDRAIGVFWVLYFAYTIGMGVIFGASVAGYVKRIQKAFVAEE